MKKLLLSLLLLTACSPHQDYIQDVNIFTSVDPQLQVYFNRYTAKTGLSTAGVTGGFIAIPSGVAGMCVYNSVSNEVRIDPAYWASIQNNDILLEQLVFHELTHCVLHLGHIYDVAPNGQPLSIMYPVAFNATQGIYLQSRETDYISAMIGNVPITYP
jgi:hypothetical protein